MHVDRRMCAINCILLAKSLDLFPIFVASVMAFSHALERPVSCK